VIPLTFTAWKNFYANIGLKRSGIKLTNPTENRKAINYWNQRHQSGPWKGITGISNFKEFLRPSQRVVELGCGSGPDIPVPGQYIGLDLAVQGLKKRRNMDHPVCCDATLIPLKRETADLIFSKDLLEHISDPEQVLLECCRILKPGGIIIHRDAWLSRKWRADGLFTRTDKESKPELRLRQFLVQVSEMKAVRWPTIFVSRILREIHYKCFCHNHMKLDYRYFTPNLDEYLESDSDACASIDPHAVILFYLSRGFEVLRSNGLWGRLCHRRHIIVRKAHEPHVQSIGRPA
jgi:SAM-dependent methyltransferase